MKEKMLFVLALAPVFCCCAVKESSTLFHTRFSLRSEAPAKRVELMVFRAGDGGLDARVCGEGVSSLDADVSRGLELNWYLFANLPEGLLDGVSRESQLRNLTIGSQAASSESEAMHASGSLVAEAGMPPLQASLLRYGCMISLDSIFVRYAGAFAERPPCVLKEARLVNVPAAMPLSGDAPAGGWTSESQALQEEIPSEGLLAGLSFYCLPNPLSEGEVAALALRVEIGTQSYWYSVFFPSMRGNTHYAVRRVDILGAGAPEPGQEPGREGIEYSVDVLEWSEEDKTLEF